MKNRLINNLFIVTVLIQVCICVYFGSSKIGLFGDEIWSYNLANCYFEPLLGDASQYYNTWLDSDFWQSRITVSENTAFAYNSVIYNQSLDVHPPLYYILLHTVCSFYPNEFSKWFGIIPNIICFIIIQILMYKSTSEFFKDKYLGLITIVLYGFSWGTINNVVFIRMYVMLVLIALVSYIFHINMLQQYKTKHLLFAALSSVLGILTQYYFLVFQFFVSLGFIIIKFIKKEYNVVLCYMFTYLFVLLISWSLFPVMTSQILGKVGNQGQTAFNNLATTSILGRIGIFGHIISRDLFGAHIKYLVCLMCVLLLLYVLGELYNFKIKLINEKQIIEFSLSSVNNDIKFQHKISIIDTIVMYSTFICAGYFLIISKVAPYYESRYMVIIQFIIAIVFAYFFKVIISLYTKNHKHIFCCLAALVTAFSINTYGSKNLFAFDYGIEKVLKEVHCNKNQSTFIVITKESNWWPVINEILVLKEVRNSYMMLEKDIDNLPDILKNKSLKNCRPLIIFRAHGSKISEKDFAKFCLDNLSAKEIVKLSNYMGETYLIK